MIARMWHGRVPLEMSEKYHEYLLATGLKDYASIEGNKGVMLLKKNEDTISHFYTWSYWDTIASIKKFAGEDYEKARYYEEDGQYLLEFEPMVTHFEVLEAPGCFNFKLIRLFLSHLLPTLNRI